MWYKLINIKYELDEVIIINLNEYKSINTKYSINIYHQINK